MMRGGDATQAILEFQVMTQSYPELPGPYTNLGLLYRKTGQLAESEAALQKATERANWDAATWTEYGVTLRQAGKFAEARSAYEQRDRGESGVRAGAPQSRCAARPVPR